MGFPGGSAIKKLPAVQGPQETWLSPWVGEIPWRRAWQATPVFLPGEFIDRGAWQATVHRVAKSFTRRKQLSKHEYIYIYIYIYIYNLYVYIYDLHIYM